MCQKKLSLFPLPWAEIKEEKGKNKKQLREIRERYIKRSKESDGQEKEEEEGVINNCVVCVLKV